ncbi:MULTISPECIES: hypothetical protein [unclassified Pseudoclavibacter]|uniref:hypothetical protein n=1 Tax=unclassified Pseudoclavibacter TaxID=2615177 RepID=UPI001BACFA96|nr:hypothetical protein [Pseudoclavibacter sp. Marseille-Q4354]MBS3177757.1 hypothetical protein [Pseudoclavibacter sp. Marseille-Q4354]
MRTFKIDDLEFLDHQPSVDWEGYLIEENGVTGWHDGVDARRDADERHYGHGAFGQPGDLDARVIVVRGKVVARTVLKLEHLRRRLTSFLADGHLARISEDVAGETWWAQGRQGTRPTAPLANSGDTFSPFQLNLWCENPRIFSDTFDFGPNPGSVFIEQTSGTFEAEVELEITAITSMVGGYGVHLMSGAATLGHVRVQATLSAGQTHVIRDGVVYQNGAPILGAVQSGDSWTLPPNGTYLAYLAPVSEAGSGSVRVRGLNTRV